MWRSGTMPNLLLVSIISSLCLTIKVVDGRGHYWPKGACYFVFGDSFSSSGNNNVLPTRFKANYPPYGIDFFGGVPTGRFTNGLTYVDILTELVGLDHLISPFNSLALTEQPLLDGVNYASGSAGILPETGRQLGVNVWLGQQIRNHRLVVSRIGSSAASKNRLHECLYTINMGSNDYVNNYFIPEYYNTSKVYTPTQFATFLVDRYAQLIKDLHDLGARKFAIYGLGYLGCAPAFGFDDKFLCNDTVNSAVLLFNHNLLLLIDELNSRFNDSRFTYINTTSIAPFTGYKVIKESCCPVTADNLCQPQSTPCSNRDDYYFWDNFHLTQRVNAIAGRRAYNAQLPTDVYPVDISHLLVN